MAVECARPRGRELVKSRRAFGEALQRHREQRGITLETISELTKINASLLAALERGDCSRWPAGIYSRAYIRDYAQAIGLDRDEVAARFTECFSETAFPEGAPPARDTAPGREIPCTPLRMTFEERPAERRRAVARRALAVLFDLVLTLALAAAVAATTPVNFWMALAGVSVGCQILGVLRRGAAWTLRPVALRNSTRSSDPPAPDPALAEAA